MKRFRMDRVVARGASGRRRFFLPARQNPRIALSPSMSHYVQVIRNLFVIALHRDRLNN